MTARTEIDYEFHHQGPRCLVVPMNGHTEGLMRWALPDGLWLVVPGGAPALSLPSRDVPDFLGLIDALEMTA